LQLPNVSKVVPERSGRQTVRFGNIDYATTIQGIGPDQPEVRDWPVAKGNFFNESDIRSYAPVAVLGQSVVEKLFPYGDDPIGDFILINNTPFEVIGVMSIKGASFGSDQDDAVFIPYTTGLIRLFGGAYLNGLTVKITDLNKLDQTQEDIRQLLMERHRTEDFNIRNMASFIDMISDTQMTLTILLGAVAAISLLVGGIGVMNIMLVSITERTREIGIRMATGARMRDIFVQFNTESAVVCTVGGLIGIALGFSIGFGLRLLGINVVFSAGPSLMAFACAFMTGLIFGYWPARQAARLDPVVALSSE
jgi:macrolide transport system ATP-binding/permease protein